MVDTGDDDVHPAERRTSGAAVRREAWQQTVDEAQAMVEARREDGQRAIFVPAGDTAAVAPSDGDDDRFGLVFVIPGNKAEPTAELVADFDLAQYDVYRRIVDDHVFVVVEYFDPDEASVFVAGMFDAGDAHPMVSAAREAGVVNTYLQKLDGTPVATFEHDDLSKFVPLDRFPVEN